MKREIAGLFLALGILVGCGGGGGHDHAPVDAVVTAPKDATATVPSPGDGSIFYRDLNFVVRNSRGERVPGVEIELTASGFLADDAFFIDKAGKKLGDYLEKTTDEFGAVSVAVQVDLPPSSDSDINAIISVDANVGASSALWTAKVTVQKLPDVTP
jgi:hypothetical protein